MILNQGYLIKRKATSRQVEHYTMRLIDPKELDLVMNLQKMVYDGLLNKDVLYCDTKRDILTDLEQGAMIIGVFNSREQLISYRYISFPSSNVRNLGHDIRLDEVELEKVVHLETTLVHPDYRGNRLQSLTLSKAIELVEPMQMKHLLCTVSPYNPFSLHNIMTSGLKIKALKRKYGSTDDSGMWRFILHKDLDEGVKCTPDIIQAIPMADIRFQKKIIEEGYVGYHLNKESQIIQYAYNC